jgi:hypothetical protein
MEYGVSQLLTELFKENADNKLGAARPRARGSSSACSSRARSLSPVSCWPSSAQRRCRRFQLTQNLVPHAGSPTANGNDETQTVKVMRQINSACSIKAAPRFITAEAATQNFEPHTHNA